MPKLSAADLFKVRVECRRTNFINRFNAGKEFKMEKGPSVIFDKDLMHNKQFIELIRTSSTTAALAKKTLKGWPVNAKSKKEKDLVEYTLSAFTKTEEFGGGRRGGGDGMSDSKRTELVESAAAVFAKAMFNSRLTKFSAKDLEAAYRKCTVDADLNDILTKLPENWFITTRFISEKIFTMFHSKFGSSANFHRGGYLVDAIEAKYKELNNKEVKFSNVNKWTPADIWLSNKSKESEMLTTIGKTTSLFELNAQLRIYFNSNYLIGISLKMVNSLPTAKTVNLNRLVKRPKAQFVNYNMGKTVFYNSMDCYLDGLGPSNDTIEIQFRISGSSFQGEIKGATANHGKVSYGPMIIIMKELRMGVHGTGTLYGRSKFDVTELKRKLTEKDDKVLKLFYENYKATHKDIKTDEYNEFIKNIEDKSADWQFSKYMAAAFMHEVKKQNINTKHMLITRLISYAASQSELSAPFLKLS